MDQLTFAHARDRLRPAPRVANGARPELWRSLLKDAGIGSKNYLITDNYPDEELDRLVQAAARHLERSREDVLEDFGHFIVAGLLSVYGVLINPRWDLWQLLLHTEETIHRVVRLRDPNAKPPHLKIVRPNRPTSGHAVTIFYRSPRNMCWFGKGIVRGLADHFGEEVSIRDLHCMGEGDDFCEISVTAPGST